MIGVGVVGFGYWGPNVARCFAEAEGCRLVGIADASADARHRAGKRHPSAAIYEDCQALIADPAVDAVVVATPVHAHYEVALATLLAGKHVLVEKPMTQSAVQAETLIETAAKRNLTLMVDHTFVYTGAVQKLRQLVESGELGQIYYYDSTRINLGLFQSDVNVIWDLAVHDLSILEFILGEAPTAVSANGTSHIAGSPENMAHVTLYFGSGAIAHLSVNWLAPVKVRQTLVGGSRKMVIYDDMEASEKIKVYDRGINVTSNPEEIQRLRVGYRIGDMWAPRLSTREALSTEAEHFVQCIQSSKAAMTDGPAGLRVVQTLEAATESMRHRGLPVDLQPMKKAS